MSKMRMPSSVTSVSPVSGKSGLAPGSHTLNNSCDLVLYGSASISPATLHRQAGGFLMPSLCVGPFVQICHRHDKIVDMSDEQTDQ